jgi:hypothetical protein
MTPKHDRRGRKENKRASKEAGGIPRWHHCTRGLRAALTFVEV